MSARRSVRLRGRSDNVAMDFDIDAIGGNVRANAARKRQRRLTAAQRAVDGQAVAALKPQVINILRPKQDAERKIDNNALNKIAQDSDDLMMDAQEFVVNNKSTSKSNVSSDSEMHSCEEQEDVIGYRTAGPSHKIAPGKRIKWRNAIMEDDAIRQNLTSRFQ